MGFALHVRGLGWIANGIIDRLRMECNWGYNIISRACIRSLCRQKVDSSRSLDFT